MLFPQLSAHTPRLPAILLAVFVLMSPVIARAAQQLTCSPANLYYGAVMVGHSQTFLVMVTNNGSISTSISGISSSASEFKLASLNLPQTIAPGASLGVNVTFAPLDRGISTGQITFVSNASNTTLNMNVSGAGSTSQSVTASPAAVSFGKVAVGSNSTVPVVLTNTQSSSIVLNGLRMTSTIYSVSGVKFPLTLAAGKSTTLNVTYKPQAAGVTGGSSFVSGPSLSIPLSGEGTVTSQPTLTVSPSTLDFGNVAVGTSESLTVGLSATGGSVTISSASSSSSLFTMSGVTFPVTIASGKEVSLNVKFSPTKDANATGTLSFKNNTTTSTMNEAMTGTGTSSSVSLSWIASTSQVTGYNVYRGTSKTGTLTKINSSLNKGTSYTDSTVTSGTYYYATTAVNSSGAESGYSNEVKAVVP